MIDKLLASQKAYFQTGATLSVDFRIRMLKKLRDAVQRHEADIALALKEDLGKSETESYMCETGMVLSEIGYLIRHIRKFAAPQHVPTPLAQFPASSYRLATPYGSTLIMSPWNYPFLLTVGPLADAIAAGNTAIVKPSAYAPATSRLLEKLLGECFPREYIAAVTGGRQENAALLSQKFDLVFFTGSQAVGKEVLRRCAEHLTPAILELGGKSPCIVDSSADLKLAARRIVFGKFLNCGQTCVAPDYILCQEDCKDALLAQILLQIRRQYGGDPLKNPAYGKIINKKHFDRIRALIDPEKAVAGGVWNEQTLQIAPTVLDNACWEDAAMGEEIFGPVLPVLTFRQFDEVFTLLQNRPKPLALYLFSENKAHIRAVRERCAFGGGCVNDTVIHLATSQMGFGGVGESGMGSYHGKAGFDAFSHTKSIVDKKTWLDIPMRYQPYRKLHRRLIRLFLK